MRAGRLRHRVTIQSKSVTRDAYGGEVITWQDDVTVWGSVEPLRGREYIEGKQEQADVTHKIFLRYRSGITPTSRLQHDSRNFEVVDVINKRERKREIEARRGGSAG